MKHYFDSGFYLDVGANDGIFKNKTISLEKQGWSGLCIEANPLIFPRLVQNRSCICVDECVVSKRNSGKKIKFFISDASGLHSGIIASDDFDSKDKFRWNTKEKINMFLEKKSLQYKDVEIQAKSLCEVLEDTNCPKVIEYAKFDIEGAEEEVLSDFPFEEYRFLFLVIELATETLHKKLCDNGYVYVGRESDDDYFVNVHNPHLSQYTEKPFIYSGGHVL